MCDWALCGLTVVYQRVLLRIPVRIENWDTISVRSVLYKCIIRHLQREMRLGLFGSPIASERFHNDVAVDHFFLPGNLSGSSQFVPRWLSCCRVFPPPQPCGTGQGYGKKKGMSKENLSIS